MTPTVQVLAGDCRERLAALPEESIHCCVTSPPYWRLRDYGVNGQLGLEATPEEYVTKMVSVFREVRRVLRKDGTCWLNLGDVYNGSGHKDVQINSPKQITNRGGNTQLGTNVSHLKPKDLVGIPWRVAFALQADGWWFRQDIIWAKPNPMPESVTDRCTKSHEYIFLLSKSARYHYDAEAITEPLQESSIERWKNPNFGTHDKRNGDAAHPERQRSAMLRGQLEQPNGRNKRSVWTVPTAPYSEAHFATFPPDLIKPCILAGCPVGGTVLDPFAGSGTTGQVALELGRSAVLIELNPDYVKLIEQRIHVTPGLAL